MVEIITEYQKQASAALPSGSVIPRFAIHLPTMVDNRDFVYVDHTKLADLDYKFTAIQPLLIDFQFILNAIGFQPHSNRLLFIDLIQSNYLMDEEVKNVIVDLKWYKHTELIETSSFPLVNGLKQETDNKGLAIYRILDNACKYHMRIPKRLAEVKILKLNLKFLNPISTGILLHGLNIMIADEVK